LGDGAHIPVERSRNMAYAVFKDEEKISRTFPTREEALKKADEAAWSIEATASPLSKTT
jgi:hypothetical protein